MGLVDDIINWIRDTLQRLSEWLQQQLTEWRERLFGYGDYREPWHWDPAHSRWVYGGSEEGYPMPDGTKGKRKRHVCTESVIARIHGRAPVSTDAACDTPEVEAKLREIGWVEGECNCGCGEGQSKDCVVLYVSGDRDVFHAAIFDHVRCDWGGKLSGYGPIVRFKRARDYLGYGTPPADSRMIFYCPGPPGSKPGGGDPVRPAPGTQLTDEQMHAMQ